YDNELSGQIITISAFIVMPMCITMITNTILNSMNCEKRTLLYFFFGAAAMLISIFSLTKFIGIYSYIVGLALSNLITAVLNLRLLKKKCPGINYVKYTLRGIGVTLVTCLFGWFLNGIISRYLSPFLQILVCAPLILAFTAGALYCLEMFTLHPLKRLVSKE
ncbi:MAG: hypothetical protein HDP34_05105, partial [Clostridia bacterium]|nr:hypothetical protein [Clostridia bacterium]